MSAADIVLLLVVAVCVGVIVVMSVVTMALDAQDRRRPS